jgi:hypothetical protein
MEQNKQKCKTGQQQELKHQDSIQNLVTKDRTNSLWRPCPAQDKPAFKAFLAAGCFDRETLDCEQPHHQLTVIALHFNHAIFDRAARAARGFELLTQLRQ